MSAVWRDLHKNYKEQDWIDKPSIFAEQALPYFPKGGIVLELGAGQDRLNLLALRHLLINTAPLVALAGKSGALCVCKMSA